MPPVTLSLDKGLGRTAYFTAGVTLFAVKIRIRESQPPPDDLPDGRP